MIFYVCSLLFSHLKEIDGTTGQVTTTALILALADLLNVKDPGMLTLEISGLVTKYPDIW